MSLSPSNVDFDTLWKDLQERVHCVLNLRPTKGMIIHEYGAGFPLPVAPDPTGLSTRSVPHTPLKLRSSTTLYVSTWSTM